MLAALVSMPSGVQVERNQECKLSDIKTVYIRHFFCDGRYNHTTVSFHTKEHYAGHICLQPAAKYSPIADIELYFVIDTIENLTNTDDCMVLRLNVTARVTQLGLFS